MKANVEVHQTTKTTTVIGLVFEGFGLLMMIVGLVFLQLLSTLSVNDLMAEGLSQGDAQIVLLAGAVLRLVLLVLTFIVSLFYMVNLWLFTKLVKQRYDYETVQKVLLYQAIYGGFNMLFNQIVGVLYLISGINGRQSLKVPQETVRDGL